MFSDNIHMYAELILRKYVSYCRWKKNVAGCSATTENTTENRRLRYHVAIWSWLRKQMVPTADGAELESDVLLVCAYFGADDF